MQKIPQGKATYFAVRKIEGIFSKREAIEYHLLRTCLTRTG